MTPHEKRQYQDDYHAKVISGWDAGHRKQVVVSPTGSGKTVMFCRHVQEAVDGFQSVLILVDQDELVWQTLDKLKSVAGIIGEPEKAEWKASTSAEVVVATVQSMARRLDKWPKNAFGLVIADEADKSVSPQWQGVLRHFDGEANVLGFTATPHRTDRKNLGVYYENAIELENLTSLIRKRFLSPIVIRMMPIKLDLNGKGAGRDFTDEEADDIITPHLEEIAKQINEHACFRRTLVFLPLIKTCEKFNGIARDLGINSEYIYGQDPFRESKLARFKAWEIDVMANSMLLTRGVDIPHVDCIVPCRPTKSITLYFQMVGRGTRIAPGKTDCLLLDFLYQSSKRLACRPAHLIAKTDEEAEQITKLLEPSAALPTDVIEQLDLLEVAADASSQREEALCRKLQEHANKKEKLVSAEEFAMRHGSLDAAEFEPTMRWQLNDVTEKQAKYLERAGIDLDTVRGTDHAAKLLDIYFKTKPVQLASLSQRMKMKQFGRSNWETATVKEAVEFFKGLRNRRAA